MQCRIQGCENEGDVEVLIRTDRHNLVLEICSDCDRKIEPLGSVNMELAIPMKWGQ
jgi:hypothetical protein